MYTGVGFGGSSSPLGWTVLRAGAPVPTQDFISFVLLFFNYRGGWTQRLMPLLLCYPCLYLSVSLPLHLSSSTQNPSK